MRSFLSCWVLIAHASAMENRERGERAVGGGGGLEIALVLEAWYRLTRKTTAAIAPHEPFAKWLFRHSAHLAAAADGGDNFARKESEREVGRSERRGGGVGSRYVGQSLR